MKVVYRLRVCVKTRARSANGAECNSLGHRPRWEPETLPSAEGAQWIVKPAERSCFRETAAISRLWRCEREF
ncbi:MAG: hypothetical protein ACRD9S_20440 [Pyrinomonadaceae bacterium]